MIAEKKNVGGRPPIYDADVIADKMELFIEEHEEPFIQEFCLNEGMSPDTFYRLMKVNERLSEAHKKALAKQELYILKNAPTGKYNPVFAIFKLKQAFHGWTDKVEQVTTIDINVIPPDERRARIADLLSKKQEIIDILPE